MSLAHLWKVVLNSSCFISPTVPSTRRIFVSRNLALYRRRWLATGPAKQRRCYLRWCKMHGVGRDGLSEQGDVLSE